MDKKKIVILGIVLLIGLMLSGCAGYYGGYGYYDFPYNNYGYYSYPYNNDGYGYYGYLYYYGHEWREHHREFGEHHHH